MRIDHILIDGHPSDEHIALNLYEALTLSHDKQNNVLSVFSDESDPKKASNETYRSKNMLKAAGFKWSGGSWIIDSDKFEVAKKTITQINKTEYLITKLEDVKEYIGDATADPKKGELATKIDGYIASLASATDEAAASEEIRRYLDFFAGFHQYSFYNKMLIYIQNPNATRVSSFNGWKKKHRVVKRGSTGMKILVPLFSKGKNPLNKSKVTDDDDEKSSPIKFIVGNVYDIADTEAIDAEGDVPETPDWWGNNEPSETADKLFELVKSAAATEGIDVTNDVARHGEKGFSSGGHINITSDVAGVGRVSTMVHEYAHELMHWEDKSKFYVGSEVARNRSLAELQAESVSYVVMKHYNIPCKHHTTYLALWKATSDKVKHNMSSISTVAHHIIDKIEEEAAKTGLK